MKKITFLFLLLQVFYSPAQNQCETALPITAGFFSVGLINGTGPTIYCAENGPSTNAEWYTYTPTSNHLTTLTTDLAQNFGDTRFHIYTGSCSNLVCYTGDDDSGVLNNGLLSTKDFLAIAGTTYYIAFDNRWNNSAFSAQLIENPYVEPPINFISQPISSSATICCVTDMNGDYLDDIVTVQTNQMTVLTQLQAGGFSSAVYPLPNLAALPGWSIASGDYDKNGFNDLVFGSNSRITVVKNTGTTFTEVRYNVGIFTQRTNFIDINNDGNLDLFACHDTAQSLVFRNDGGGNLVLDTNFFPTLPVGGNYASIWTDYNNDGFQDMYLAKCRASAPVGDQQRINLLYKNNGNGTFTEVGAQAGVNDGAQSWSTSIEDFDNDGDMDFLLSNISDTNKFYRNNGDGTFTDIYASTGIAPQVGSWEIQAADFNNDGFIDFLWQNGKEIYLNNGNLTFTGYDIGISEGGIGDLNNDGFLDIQFASSVYYNTPNANNWIKINLKGVQSNINGIGARVELYGAWGKQIREIRSGHGFSHQSTMNAHFGIGAATAITKIVIKWPSGVVDTILNPALNQAILVTESSTLGVDENQNSLFALYPNPAKDFLNIQLKDKSASLESAKIHDLNGRIILEPKITENNINVQSLNTGTYILSLKSSSGEKFSQQFIKQ
ncbi:FG-GAP-like repeat-containing protein [uncultured Flavobacterium sp.]|uniref:FG-GAP-like repeat-containing protein n=1 Tax=uncultured Flavobacterium sp. TaxID=165435 RepID=UPI0025D0913E|nr:FG-GAP-like repeat-containing protein [uncultured Flavobacterium sp.]